MEKKKVILPGEDGFGVTDDLGKDPANPGGKRWSSRDRWPLHTRKGQLVRTLRSVSPMNGMLWLELGAIFKRERDWIRAEISYLGARYCNYADRGVMMQWLEMFVASRAATMTKEQIHREADMIARGIVDVVNDPARLAHELQHLLWCLEREEVVAMHGKPVEVQVSGPKAHGS